MEIKILGTGCASCKTLYQAVQKAVEELSIEATIVKEEDLVKIMEYAILSTPALVINDKVVSMGKKLTIAEIKSLLERHL